MTSLFYQDDRVLLYQADVLEWAIEYKKRIDSGDALPFMATVTDPPYGLSEPPPVEKVLTAWLAGEKYEHNKGGMMGKRWDNLPPGPRYWRALLNITYPGGYLFAFSGTRTADLLGIACRLGGWELFDRIASFGWVQGQGMKKGADVGKALDKEVGADREVVGRYDLPDVADGRRKKSWGLTEEAAARHAATAVGITPATQGHNLDITAPATPLAKAFNGYGTGLAPKHEPILLFRKPREDRTFAQCAREFGSGGLDVDSCRVRTSDSEPNARKNKGDGKHSDRAMFGVSGAGEWSGAAGRWPPNTHFTHVPHHSPCPTCEGDGDIPMLPATMEQMMHDNKVPCPECRGVGMVGGCRRVGSKRVKCSGLPSTTGSATTQNVYEDRFKNRSMITHAGPDGKETVADWLCVEGCAVRALDEMAGERKTGALKPHYNLSKDKDGHRTAQLYGRYKRQPENREASTGNCSRFFPNHDWSYEIAERLAGETPFRYCAKVSSGERRAGLQDSENGHPTLKPISLIKWLMTLATPPPQFKPRVCIPFSGAGSEIIAAVLSGGWTEIHAIEREQEYCEIAAARIAWWSKWAALTRKTDPAEIRKLGEAAEAKTDFQGDERQIGMFEILERNGRTPGVQGSESQ